MGNNSVHTVITGLKHSGKTTLMNHEQCELESCSSHGKQYEKTMFCGMPSMSYDLEKESIDHDLVTLKKITSRVKLLIFLIDSTLPSEEMEENIVILHQTVEKIAKSSTFVLILFSKQDIPHSKRFLDILDSYPLKFHNHYRAFGVNFMTDSGFNQPRQFLERHLKVSTLSTSTSKQVHEPLNKTTI